MIRINKFLASCTEYSRRQSERIVEEGRVFVNGCRVTDLATYVDPQKDEVYLDDTLLTLSSRHIYIKFYKPPGVLTSHGDPQGRKIVTDCLPLLDRRVFCVGRLDYDSEGLLVLTSHGDWAHRLLHPRYEKEREYRVFLNRPCSLQVVQRIREGETFLEDGQIIPTSFVVEKKGVYRIVIREGKNREVRRIFSFHGYEVVRLIRLRFSNIHLDSLRSGEYAHLNSQEINIKST